MMADTTTNSDLEEFLGKIDTIHDLINDIKVSDGTEGDSALKKADEFIERNEVKVTRNRTVINTSAVPSTSAPGQSINAAPVDMSSLPEGVSPEQAAFMASVEQDAKDRAKRRMQREKEALVPKEKGNAAFKEGAYAVAVEHYLEATRIDPANPLLYTNTAQAYIKMGEFEKAVERCDIAVRADERCLKAYVRRGLAKRALGEYAEAQQSFKTARSLASKAQLGTIDRHVEDTTLAHELALRHSRLQAATLPPTEKVRGTHDSPGGAAGTLADGNQHEAFKVIELGCAKLLTSVLPPRDAVACCALLGECLAGELPQDLFRLRKGTRILVENATCKAWLTAPSRGENADAVPLVSAALRLLRVAAVNNEASRRDIVEAPQRALLLDLLHKSSDASLIVPALELLREVGASDRVRDTFRKVCATEGCVVHAIFHAVREGHQSYKASAARGWSICSAGINTLSVFLTHDMLRSRACQLVHEDNSLLDMLFELARTHECALAVLSLLSSLSADTALRQALGTQAVVQRLLDLSTLYATRETAAWGPTATANLFGVLGNISLDAGAQDNLHNLSSVQKIMKPIRANNTEAVTARALMLLSRLCTKPEFVDMLIANDFLETILSVRISGTGEIACQAEDARTKIMTKCLKLRREASHAMIGAQRGISTLKDLLQWPSASLVGNVALCIAELATRKDACAAVADTTIVADLLNVARKDKNKSTENCAIAIARLAAGHPRHLARLRELGGIEVLHHRAPKDIK
eukprot:m.985402 g.985402  ORF g.985402 m.985402 type:complete len:756 (-) comp23982_c2_seq18:1289-3556(-)